MDKTTKQHPRALPAFLTGPWPVVVLLACHFALGLSAASQKSVAFDEITHLASGYTYWARNDYRMDPESGNWPQRWAAVPLLLGGYKSPATDDPAWRAGQQWDYADLLLYKSGYDADAMLLCGRAMIGLLSVALGLLVYLWSRELFGPIGGLISLAFYAFSPTTLSTGFMVTADLTISLFFTLAIWVLWKLLHRVNWLTLLGSCFALAGLFLSKYSAVLIIPMGALLVAVRMLNSQPLVWSLGRPREIKGRLRQLAVLFAVAAIQILVVALLIWISYGLRFSKNQPSSPSPPAVIPLEVLLHHGSNVGLTRPFVQFAMEHRLLPESYLYGFAYTMLTAQQRQAFLNGDFSLHGWPIYFPYALLVKTPPEFFIVLLLALAGLWFWRSRTQGKAGVPAEQPGRRARWYSLAPLWILLGVYWTFSLTSHLNIGHRHLLPTYPAMFILAGAAAAWFPSAATATAAASRRKLFLVAKSLIAASLLLALVEALGNWPNYLAYFNIFVGGSQNGYKHLVDSSLDWGQDLKGLKHWLNTHPDDASNVYLCYFGTASPEYYGIHARTLPGFFNHYQVHVPEPLTPGTYCISATLLQGVYLQFPSKWNAVFENLYQQCRERVLAYRTAANDPSAMLKLLAGSSQKDIDTVFTFYEALRLARLCSFLRAREPDFNVGHTILIFRLNQTDIDRATEGPPIELLPDCAPDVKTCLGIH